MPHGKPITISRVEYVEPSPIPRGDVVPGQVYSHLPGNADDRDLYVALAGHNPYVQTASLARDEYLLAMQVSTGRVTHSSLSEPVFLRDADLTVGGAK